MKVIANIGTNNTNQTINLVCMADFLDLDGYSNGEKKEHWDAKNYTLDLANSSFIPGFAEQLVNRRLGEDFEINVTFPAEYHEKKLAGQPAVFKCKINEIKT